jgi:translation initiation factor 1A
MQKKVWINVGDIILISLRDYQDEKADVIYKYNPDEARALKAKGELPENAKINEGGEGDENEENDGIMFADADSEEEEVAEDSDIDIDDI